MNDQYIFDFLTGAGMTKAGAAGMMGNLYAESGLIPNRVEILCLQRLRENGQYYTDATYTAFVDDGTISRSSFLNPLPGRQYGYGLAQWTSPSRKAGLYDLCKIRKASIGDLKTQLDFLVIELQESYQSVWKTLTSTESVYTAAEVILKQFEIPDNASSMVKTRADYAYNYYNKCASNNKEENKMGVPEKALSWALGIAADQSHGYSQTNRYGPDYDCSSLVLTAYKKAGADVGNATYTGNMYSELTNHDFKDVTASVDLTTGIGLQKGDILMYHLSGTAGHTALYAGGGQIVHARGQSYGSPATGDQGTEIAVTAYSRSRWQYVLRYNGSEADIPDTPSQPRYEVKTTLPIIKKGSMGDTVRVWQIIAGVDADGEFGPDTDTATKVFQTAHGLEVDGEVGPQTWSAGLSEAE